MTPLANPVPFYKDREAHWLAAAVVAVSLLCFPPWIRDKCAEPWRCGIGGGR